MTHPRPISKFGYLYQMKTRLMNLMKSWSKSLWDQVLLQLLGKGQLLYLPTNLISLSKNRKLDINARNAKKERKIVRFKIQVPIDFSLPTPLQVQVTKDIVLETLFLLQEEDGSVEWYQLEQEVKEVFQSTIL